MTIDPKLDDMFRNTKPVEVTDEDIETLVDLSGFQVTKAELFAHSREPAITIWENKIKFNIGFSSVLRVFIPL